MNRQYANSPHITYVDRVVVRAYTKQVGASGVLKLPTVLECNLSELPAGFERAVVRGHLILFESATRRIVDTLPYAFSIKR
jgi:hypothetical protein